MAKRSVGIGEIQEGRKNTARPILVNIQSNDEIVGEESDDCVEDEGNELFEIDEEEAQIAEAFRAFDHNNDGYLDITDLRRVLLKLGHNLDDEELQEVLDEADSNGDGKIDYYEFKKMMLREDTPIEKEEAEDNLLNNKDDERG
ncbi:DgyrCDS8723 [Dimorphilus gyrociliatus]|uniref:DgyrCDS8723 n=1 Tax=Dimorphilus gyrociliatus TaxID=2664684 RepID=A0A7I8VX76_9ANNE|nr:DgyrCDS8723 [Dimorphilus gyrociliatus]